MTSHGNRTKIRQASPGQRDPLPTFSLTAPHLLPFSPLSPEEGTSRKRLGKPLDFILLHPLNGQKTEENRCRRQYFQSATPPSHFAQTNPNTGPRWVERVTLRAGEEQEELAQVPRQREVWRRSWLGRGRRVGPCRSLVERVQEPPWRLCQGVGKALRRFPANFPLRHPPGYNALQLRNY